ncbi:hypothetical protein [Aquisalimonas asiatica]|uniref:Uncharacterized protein n=1 Tax=Aquisalimonas asiatica TaxID=406100 RepID=A0A1H8UGZ9_9GAMM|nr:hypothetical protein [Aquisalimonas asiatica]SEP01878.1 hypothetical protein SAMN04488052_106166 [Aquisalimonas asiatica]
MTQQYVSADAETSVPGTFSETVSYAFTLYRRYFLLLLPLGLFTHAITEGYVLYLSRSLDSVMDSVTGLILFQALSIIVFCWALMFGMRRTHVLETAGWAEPFKGHPGLVGRIIVLQILCMVLGLAATLPLILIAQIGGPWPVLILVIAGSLYLGVRLWLVPAAMGVEDLWPIDAFQRSWALTSGAPAFFLTLGILAFAMVAAVLPGVLWKHVLDVAFHPAYLTHDGAALLWWLGAVGVEAAIFPLLVTTGVAILYALKGRRLC